MNDARLRAPQAAPPAERVGSSFRERQSSGTGPGHWIAANGDSIDTTAVASAKHVDMAPCRVVGAEPGDTYVKATVIHTITGGTGRFAGAQGSFNVERLASPVTFMTSGSFDGTITSPGEAHAEADED